MGDEDEYDPETSDRKNLIDLKRLMTREGESVCTYTTGSNASTPIMFLQNAGTTTSKTYTASSLR